MPKETTPVIASLMMYARPELDEAHGRFWKLIRAALAVRGIAAPERLANHAEAFAVWEAEDLVLSQTCGMPYRLRLHERVALVGTPDFGVEDCPPGYYRSAIVVRAEDARDDLAAFREARLAFNETISQSGFAAPYALAQAQGFWFQDRVQSNGHRKSAEFVADGRADIAAIDAVTWRLIQRYDDFANGLRVLAWTHPTPGLPYITARPADVPAIRAAVAEAIGAMTQEDRTALGIRGLIAIPKERYLAVENPPAETR